MRAPKGSRNGAVGAAVSLLLASPLLFSGRTFAPDFTNSIWLSYVESSALRATHFPTYFISTASTGSLAPSFAFLGGVPFTVVGAVGAVLGGRVVDAFVWLTAALIAATYYGGWRVARVVGLDGIAAHAPAIAFVTSAYFVTDLYGRAAWPEFVGLCSIPLVAGCVASIAAAHCYRVGWWCGAFVGGALFAGAHNVVLLYGALLALVGAIVLTRVRGARRRLFDWGRALLPSALGVVAASWFLVPDVLYGRSTRIAGLFVGEFEFDHLTTLFDPLRSVPKSSTTPALFVQAPVWFLGWGVAVASATLVTRRPWPRPWAAAWLASFGLLVALVGAIASDSLWYHVPTLFSAVQFPYRLNGFVALLVALLVLCTAVVVKYAKVARPGLARVSLAALMAVVAVSTALCAWQLWVPSNAQPISLKSRTPSVASITVPPSSWYEGVVYSDLSARLITPSPTRGLTIDPAIVRPGPTLLSAEESVPLHVPVATNIVAGAPFVSVGGDFIRLGRDTADFVVIEAVHQRNGHELLILSDGRGAAIVLAHWLSIAGFVLAVLGVAAVSVAPSRRQRAKRPNPRASPPASL